jgi:hypothetical protein
MKASCFKFSKGKESKDFYEGFVDILCPKNSVVRRISDGLSLHAGLRFGF